MTLLLIFLSGLMDRVRGDHFNFFRDWSRGPDMAAYGWVIAALMGHPQDWFTLPIIAALMLGMASGWGEPMGAGLFRRKMFQDRLEWWQIGPLKDNVFLALTARGVMWGLPCLLLLPWLPNAWLPLAAYTVAFPASIYLVRLLSPIAAWASDRISGWLAAPVVERFSITRAISRAWQELGSGGDMWEWTERTRGWMAAAIVAGAI